MVCDDYGATQRVTREVVQYVPESFEPGPWLITYSVCDCRDRSPLHIDQRLLKLSARLRQETGDVEQFSLRF